MQVSTLDYNSYVGVIAVGRIQRGSVKPNQQVVVVKRDGDAAQGQDRPGVWLPGPRARRGAARARPAISSR
jgi:translation elongation factor EF-4